jgi:hypothetical protein
MAALEVSLFSAYYTSHQPPSWTILTSLKALVATEVCHMVIVINNPVNRISVPTIMTHISKEK